MNCIALPSWFWLTLALCAALTTGSEIAGAVMRFEERRLKKQLLAPLLKLEVPCKAGKNLSGDAVLALREGVSLIARERARQIDEENFDAAADDSLDGGELAAMAASYALCAWERIQGGRSSFGEEPPFIWPPTKPAAAWKPESDPLRNLVKAGALASAEIDRLRRAEQERERGEANAQSVERD